MSLQFQRLPPLPERQESPDVGLQTLGQLQQAAQMYMSYKQQRAALDLQKQQRDIDLAKASGEGGQDFWNSYTALRSGKNPYGTGIPAAPGAGMAAAAPMPPTPGGLNMTPATPPDAYAGYQSIQDPFGPLPGMAPASTPAAPSMASASPQPSATMGGSGLAMPQTALDLTPAHLAEIRSQKGSKGLKEYMDQQTFLSGQQKDQASATNMNLDNESKLRGDYTKASGNFKTVSENLQTIQSVAKKPPSAAGDISLVFSYMKLMDPNSTVREGEYSTASNAAGAGDRLRAMYNKLLDGQALAPAQRANFINTSSDIYQGWLDKQKQTDDAYRGIATRSRVNPDNVLIPFGVPNFDRAAMARSPGASDGHTFQSAKDAEAARLPKGTIVMIGGRRAVIE